MLILKHDIFFFFTITSLMHFIYNNRFDTCWDVRIKLASDEPILTKLWPTSFACHPMNLTLEFIGSVLSICTFTGYFTEFQYTDLLPIYFVYNRLGVDLKVHVPQFKPLTHSIAINNRSASDNCSKVIYFMC